MQYQQFCASHTNQNHFICIWPTKTFDDRFSLQRSYSFHIETFELLNKNNKPFNTGSLRRGGQIQNVKKMNKKPDSKRKNVGTTFSCCYLCNG